MLVIDLLPLLLLLLIAASSPDGGYGGSVFEGNGAKLVVQYCSLSAVILCSPLFALLPFLRSSFAALLASILLSSFALSCYASGTFSALQKSLLVTSSPKAGQVLKAGEANITVTWSFNKTFPAGTDSAYKTVKVKLCYAPISQKDRGWRKTKDLLKKDRTCQHKIVKKPYTSSSNSFTWTIERDIPSATYFVRAYVFNAEDKEVAYGQTTDAAKKTNLFEVQAITGRHVSLDIASVCFSVFSIVSLAGFFYMEKRKARSSQQK